MHNVTSHSVIVASGYGIAEYTHLIGEAAHRFPDVKWLAMPHQISSLAFGLLCLIAISHAIPLFARFLIGSGTSILTVHRTVGTFVNDVLNRIEKGILTSSKNLLWRLLDKLEKNDRNDKP